MKTIAVQEFFKMFPDDNTCLEHLFKTRFGNGDEVVCPKCGHMSSFPLVENTGHALEYAGICGANFEPDLWCDAMLILQVTAHLAPAS